MPRLLNCQKRIVLNGMSDFCAFLQLNENHSFGQSGRLDMQNNKPERKKEKEKWKKTKQQNLERKGYLAF